MLLTEGNLKQIKDKRFLLYHGALDDAIPISSSIDVYQRVNGLVVLVQ